MSLHGNDALLSDKSKKSSSRRFFISLMAPLSWMLCPPSLTSLYLDSAIATPWSTSRLWSPHDRLLRRCLCIWREYQILFLEPSTSSWEVALMWGMKVGITTEPAMRSDWEVFLRYSSRWGGSFGLLEPCIYCGWGGTGLILCWPLLMCSFPYYYIHPSVFETSYWCIPIELQWSPISFESLYSLWLIP